MHGVGGMAWMGGGMDGVEACWSAGRVAAHAGSASDGDVPSGWRLSCVGAGFPLGVTGLCWRRIPSVISSWSAPGPGPHRSPRGRSDWWNGAGQIRPFSALHVLNSSRAGSLCSGDAAPPSPSEPE
ncbi:unnamed protein product [Caretta caretta]